jgi:hypothetical protein
MIACGFVLMLSASRQNERARGTAHNHSRQKQRCAKHTPQQMLLLLLLQHNQTTAAGIAALLLPIS